MEEQEKQNKNKKTANSKFTSNKTLRGLFCGGGGKGVVLAWLGLASGVGRGGIKKKKSRTPDLLQSKIRVRKSYFGRNFAGSIFVCYT